MKIHILQHVAFEEEGCIRDWCRVNDLTVSRTRFYMNETLPGIDDFDWLIIMGGPMGVYDEAQYPWLTGEKSFINEAIGAGKIVLGICLGAQMIAECLGAKVYPNKEKEIGWFNVKLNDEGIRESLLSDMPHETPVFHWHGDTFDLPGKARNLVFSEGCNNQLFIFGKRVIGIQFHFEVTEESLSAMLENGRHELIPGKFVQSENEIRSGMHQIKANNRIMFGILDGLRFEV
ncbi:MAG TPA: type 1 glutamine amidotransferase [Bacteroidales bacterium]|nr:type 1 glutamine amidotransferase [Bacteroidales bacterium]